MNSSHELNKLECDSDGLQDSKSEADLRTLTGLKVRPGEREDNKWLQYSADNKPLDQVNNTIKGSLIKFLILQGFV